jgi:hypothetical protein
MMKLLSLFLILSLVASGQEMRVRSHSRQLKRKELAESELSENNSIF